MTRLLPFPFVSTGLLILWLLLNQSLSPGHILLGSALAISGGWALTALEPPKSRVHRFGSLLRLFARVLFDIVKSNIAVARIVLGGDRPERRSGFVYIPLDLRSSYGLATLACIITSTPGTLWVNFDAGQGVLMIHVLDLTDEGEWVRTIKARYESLLLEIFE